MLLPSWLTKNHFSRREKLRWGTVGAVAVCYLACRWVIRWLYAPLGVVFLMLSKDKRILRPLRFASAGTAIMLFWMALFALVRIAPAQVLWGHTENFTAVVTDYPKESTWGYSVKGTVKTKLGLPVQTLFYFESDNVAETLSPGATLEGTGDFVSPRKAYPKRPDYYASTGIFAVCRSSKKQTLTAVPAPQKPALRYLPAILSNRLKKRISLSFDEQTAPLMLALLTGDASELSDSLTADLRRTGLIHLVAVSGLHVGIIMSFVLLCPCNRRFRQILTAIAIIGFCLLTGAKPSVVRATIMGLCTLLLPFLGRERHPLYSLRLALFALLLYNPYSILNLGLQLSFAATFGILIGQKPLCRVLVNLPPHFFTAPALQRTKRGLCEALSVTLCALAFTLPLTTIYYGTIPLISPLSNLCVDWMIPFLFLGGLLALVFTLFAPALAALAAPLIQAVFHLFFALVSFFGAMPFCAVTASPPAYVLWLVLVYALIALLLLRPHLQQKLPLFVGGAVLALICAVFVNRASLLHTGLGVQAVDVEQGQAICFYSDTQSVAVDCGGTNAGDALADALADIGETKLDALILTHFDSDHTNGIARLLSRVQVNEILIPDIQDDSGEREVVERLSEIYHIPLRCINEDETLSFGSAHITVFAPVCQPTDPTAEQKGKAKNNDNNCGLSVLAYNENQQRRILVTGDMDAKTELILLKEKKIHTVDALVVGHHGSASSTGADFLKAVQPKIAVISVGASNRYGHPSQEMLQRLKDADCKILRTDKRGTVTIP